MTQSPRPHAVLLSAPPCGPRMWDDTARRLHQHQWTTHSPDLMVHPGGPTPASVAALLADEATRTQQPIVAIAHGLAVPLTLAAAHQTPVAALVLTNGPFDHLDPITDAFVNLAQRVPGFGRRLLHPGLSQRVLASSAGMRRLVVNPYVMDRDMVVRVSEGWTASRDSRANTIRFLQNVRQYLAHQHAADCPTLILWGNEDYLYPSHVADLARATLPNAKHAEIPGGRHLHPIERPWALADAVEEWVQSLNFAPSRAT